METTIKTTLAVLLIAMNAWLPANAQSVQTVEQVELPRYVGTWYEQGRFPMYFQRECVRNTQAAYSLRADRKVTVQNQCDQANGETLKSQGVAKVVDASGAKLKVRFAPAALSFLPFVWADYWVIGLDSDYRWAVVGTPNRKYLWLLTRDKNVSDAKYTQMVEVARQQGFAVSRLKRTPQ